jgi:hypothetical protein
MGWILKVEIQCLPKDGMWPDERAQGDPKVMGLGHRAVSSNRRTGVVPGGRGSVGLESVNLGVPLTYPNVCESGAGERPGKKLTSEAFSAKRVEPKVMAASSFILRLS